jgi:hypothetical protein
MHPVRAESLFLDQINVMETMQPEQRPSRPVFLTVLCILTFITSGFSGIGLIYSTITGPMSGDEVEKAVTEGLVMANKLRETGSEGMAGVFDKIAHLAEYTNQSFYLILAVNCVIFILGLGGALLMWRGRKIGFHSYILYNILGTISIYFAVPVSEVPTLIVILQVIFSAAFIFMYSRNLHWLK